MRIKRAHDTADTVRIGDMANGAVFWDDVEAVDPCIVTDEYFTSAWARVGRDDSGARRLAVGLSDGYAALYDIDDEYPLVDGAFVEGA